MDVQVGVDAQQWSDSLRELPRERREPYFTPAFHAAHAAHGDGTPYCSIVRDDSAMLIVPGLRREIADSGKRWDLQTCRTGCAGPVASDAADSAFLERAWAGWADAMARAGAVAALFRLHPLLANQRWLPASAEIRADRAVVIVDLAGGLDAAWQRTDSRHRNMVRKAHRLGCEVSWNRDHRTFERLYADAMFRLDADQELRFGRAFFDALWSMPEVELATVHVENTFVAGAVFVWSDLCAHYLLAARRTDAGNHVSNLLLDAAMRRAVSRSVARLYLGGGRTSRANDPLLQFKRRAGTHVVPYHVALVTIDEPARQRLVESWTRAAGTSPSWLLGYRQPFPRHTGGQN